MLDISSCLGKLTPRHQAALAWFYSHQGADCGWPGDLPDGTHLASRAKGIYKPAWAKYALSVRESLTGPYMDREPDVRPNGTWSYMYYQESSKPSNRDSQYTNRGLMECLRDAVPLGYFARCHRSPRLSIVFWAWQRSLDGRQATFISKASHQTALPTTD